MSDAAISPLSEMVRPPGAGRSFERELLPGLADATASGRVRLDAVARWLQDIAYEDIVDAGLAGRGAWVVRRARVRVEAFPRFGEPVTVRTFCSGAGRVAAERRTTVSGGEGILPFPAFGNATPVFMTTTDRVQITRWFHFF